MSELTRGEFDLLRQMVGQNQARLDAMDSSSILAALQVQLTNVITDQVELKTEMLARFDAHDKLHVLDKEDQVTGRRWLIGVSLVGLGSIGTMLGFLVDIASHVR